MGTRLVSFIAIFTGVLLAVSPATEATEVDWGDLVDVVGESDAVAPAVRPAPATPKVEAAPPPAKAPAVAKPAPVKQPPVEAAPSTDEVEAVEVEVPAAPAKKMPATESASAPAAQKSSKRAEAQEVAAPPESESAPAMVAKQNEAALAEYGLKPGDVVSASNIDRHLKLLTPGMQWGVRYGWKMQVQEPEHVEMPRRYREATEKYSHQVSLRSDGLAVEGHVAGQPFPNLDLNDPKVAYRIMWNFYYNFSPTDDIAMRGIDTHTGTVGARESIVVERHLITDSYRKMYYNARLYVDPKPVVPNPEGVRFKESLHPILEPFDLKGVGFTGFRYIDPAKQDDSWLYLPQLRRVRRMSSSQRSDALFGQDTDADSFAGYNGHIAWADYSFLGEQVILASMHARNHPVKWQQPEDWLWDDVWEPRRVYVVEARSRLPQYAYSKRVLYVDKEAWVMPTTDSYDRAGQLWKSHYLQYQFRTEMGTARKFAYEDVTPAVNANIIFDVQLQHATSSGIPRELGARDGGTFTNLGTKTGVTEDFFSVAALVAAGK